MSRSAWWWVRLLGGALILVVLLRRLGAEPFLDGLRRVDGWSLLAAAGITVLTTLCCARRWQLIAHGLGAELSLRRAFGAYYRSQFLNATLPGGVLGDLDRGVRQGRDSGDVGRGLRAVAWERAAGQIVQAALAVLLLSTSPLRSSVLVIAGLSGAVVVGAVMLSRRLPAGPSLRARVVRMVSSDLRRGVLARGVWPGVVLTSGAAVAGHVVIFLIAARAAGSPVDPALLLPLAMLVLLAMSVPTNIAGWGPREGVAAWAFAAVGLGADRGVAVAVAYGVMVFVACLPGALVLVVGWIRQEAPAPAATLAVRQPAAGQSVIGQSAVGRGARHG